MEPAAQKPYDCAEEIKKLPDEFWLGAPTAKHIPYSQEDLSSENSYYKEHYKDGSWKILKKIGHKLFPKLCKPTEYYFFIPEENRGNKTFAVYKMPDGSLCREDCHHFHTSEGSDTVVYVSPTMLHFFNSPLFALRNRPYTPEGRAIVDNYYKQMKKLENLWNQLRKKALRDAGKEPSPKISKKNSEDTKSKRQKNKIRRILRIALQTRKELDSYIKKLERGKITDEDIARIYNHMIDLSSEGKEYKKITGVASKK